MESACSCRVNSYEVDKATMEETPLYISTTLLFATAGVSPSTLLFTNTFDQCTKQGQQDVDGPWPRSFLLDEVQRITIASRMARAGRHNLRAEAQRSSCL